MASPLISIEVMTPGEYRAHGADMPVCYNLETTPFGEILIASTPQGICGIEFADDRNMALESLQSRFPLTKLVRGHDMEHNISRLFTSERSDASRIRLHIKGTRFQIKVWKTLIGIPMGTIITYGDIAAAIGTPGATRAVGSAVASNPVALLIPCHRVIRSDGSTGNYHWGPLRKQAILDWEAGRRRQLF